MADEKLEVEVRANVNGFDRDMAAASKSVKGLGDASDKAAKSADSHAKKMEDLKRASTEVGKTMMIVGAAIGAGVALAVVEFAKYDKALAGFRAVSGATKAETDSLTKTAMKLGEQFGFTSVEVVNAATALSKAGISTADVLGGALQGSLNLAATDTIEVADAAEVAAIAMTQFKLAGKDVPHIADLLAAGAAKAVGDVKDLAWGLRQSGLVASQFGLTIEDTVGTLAAFASAGLIGSDAGTSFKQMLLSLASPSGVAAKKMAELGISAYDTHGKFIGVTKLAGELQRTMGGLSQESRNAALSIIFGQDAIRSAAVLYKLGADGVSEWIKKTNEAGFASKIAAEKLNNLNGDWKKLTVSVQNALIDMGSDANGFLRPLIQSVTGAVQAFRDLPEPVKGGVLAMAGLAAGALLLGGAVMTTVTKLADFKDSWDKITAASGKHKGALTTITAAVGVLTAAYAGAVIAAKMLDGALDHDKKANSSDITNRLAGGSLDKPKLSTALDESFRGVFTNRNPNLQNGLSDVNDFSGALRRIYKPTDGENLTDFSGDFLQQDGAGGKKSRAAFAELDKSLTNLASSGSTADATAAFAEMKRKAEDLKVPVGDLIKLVPNYKDAMLGLATQNGLTNLSEDEKAKILAGTSDKMKQAAAATAWHATTQKEATAQTEKFNKALDDIGLSASGAIIGLSKFTDWLSSAGLITLSARDATDKFHEALDGVGDKADKIAAGQQKFGRILNDNATDFDSFTKSGRDANAVYADVAQKGLAAASAMAKNGDAQPAIQKQLEDTYDAMVNTAKGFGMGKDEAEALTRGILHIPPGVDVKSWMEDQARIEAEKTKAAIDAINKNVQVSIDIHKTTFEKLVGLPSTIADGTYGQGLGVYAPGQAPGKAGGGGIGGAGPKGVDKDLYKLARGEHVWTADEVDKAGGQEAMYAMRSAVRSGRAYSVNGAAAQAAPTAAPVTFAPVFHVASQDTGAVVQEVKGWLRFEAQKAGLRIGG
ncbi:phage tail tape measure protein [Arthrobacter sp. UYCu723]